MTRGYQTQHREQRLKTISTFPLLGFSRTQAHTAHTPFSFHKLIATFHLQLTKRKRERVRLFVCACVFLDVVSCLHEI